MKTRVVLFAVAAALVGVASASAQLRSGTVEINPFAGYLFGGEITHRGIYYPHDPCTAPGCGSVDANVDVDDDVTYGGRIGYNFSSLVEAEFQYSRTDTQFLVRPFNGPNVRVGDLTLDYFLGYITFNFGHGRVVPYFTIGAGAANLIPSIPGSFSTSEVRYTGSLGGGVKMFLTPHFGLRFDGRAYSTYLGNNSHVYCNPYCTSQTWLTNGDVNGGFIIAF
jgi:opacity protein-like surface antigen